MSERTYQIIIGVLVVIMGVLVWSVITLRNGDMTPSSYSMAAGADNVNSADSSKDMGASTTSQASGASSNSSGADMSGSTGSMNTSASATGSMVAVSNQASGMMVDVASLTLEQAGWVAVRDADSRILGAAWFPAGSQTNVSVPLLRGTSTGMHYQVLLYADNGDKLFDLHQDTLLMNSDGSVAGTTFMVN